MKGSCGAFHQKVIVIVKHCKYLVGVSILIILKTCFEVGHVLLQLIGLGFFNIRWISAYFAYFYHPIGE